MVAVSKSCRAAFAFAFAVAVLCLGAVFWLLDVVRVAEVSVELGRLAVAFLDWTVAGCTLVLVSVVVVVALSNASLEFPSVTFGVLFHAAAAVAVVLPWVSTAGASVAVAVVVLVSVAVAVVLVFVLADGIESSLMADAFTLTLLADDDTFMAVAVSFSETLSFFPASVMELSTVAISISIPILELVSLLLVL